MGDFITEKEQSVVNVEEKNATHVEQKPIFLTTTTYIAAGVGPGLGEVNSQSEEPLMKVAYKRWANAPSDCRCTEHYGNPVINKEFEPKCERQRYWWIYVKVRDGHELSSEELGFLGFT